jgi:hypothetical protein
MMMMMMMMMMFGGMVRAEPPPACPCVCAMCSPGVSNMPRCVMMSCLASRACRWLARRYAVLDGPTFPIIAEGDEEPNDTFVEQLTASAEAAVEVCRAWVPVARAGRVRRLGLQPVDVVGAKAMASQPPTHPPARARAIFAPPCVNRRCSCRAA